MSRAGRTLLLASAAVVSVLAASPARSQVVGPPSPPTHGQVLLFFVDRVPFEYLLSREPVGEPFRRLAESGGVALMATKVTSSNKELASYAAIGSGTRSAATEDGHLLERVLQQHGVAMCVATGLFPKDRADLAAVSPSLEPCSGTLPADVVAIGEASTLEIDRAARAGNLPASQRINPLALAALNLARIQSSFSSPRTAVLVVTPLPSLGMELQGDEVTPLVLAYPHSNLSPTNVLHALKSDTTRQTGLVSNVDVAPTILHFFGIPIPSGMDGSPIEATDAPAPYDLHRLHLEQRRIRLPIQLAEVAYVAGLGIVGIIALIVLAVRGSLSRRFAASMRFATLVGVAEGVTLLAGGLLPRLTYAWVVPYLVITMVGLAAQSLTARARGPLGPFIFLGAVSLGFVLLDGVLGGQAFRVPLLGGTMFDGVRFYGLPNSFIALPLAGALFLAVDLDPFRGFLLLVGVGLFCGFPSLGANVGAAITLFAAAGLWWVVRTRPRFGIREVAFVAGVVALGTAVVLLANRVAPGTPTHVGRFVERSGGSLHRAITDLRHRLGIGVGQLRDVPAAFIPVLGLFVVLGLALRPIGPIANGLRLAGDRWRQMIAVLSIASIVAFVANDTGVAAAAPGFMFALTALAYPAYLTETALGPRRVGRGGVRRADERGGGVPAVNSRGPSGGDRTNHK